MVVVVANRLDKQGAASSVTAKCHLDVDDRGAAVLRGCSTMFSKKRSSMREKERKGDMQSAGERERESNSGGLWFSGTVTPFRQKNARVR